MRQQRQLRNLQYCWIQRLCQSNTATGVLADPREIDLAQPLLERQDAPFSGKPELRFDREPQETFERVVYGYASITGTPYQMYDAFGEYIEVVAPGAFTRTLASQPEVAHRIQHEGLGLSTTRNNTLTLTEDDTGLAFRSIVDTRETDAADLVRKIERGTVSHTSFAFRIDDYDWLDDYRQLVIKEVSLDGGDVASCCYGANPYGGQSVESQPATADAARHADKLEVLAEAANIDNKELETAAQEATEWCEQMTQKLEALRYTNQSLSNN